jgi:hypothetical protein
MDSATKGRDVGPKNAEQEVELAALFGSWSKSAPDKFLGTTLPHA